MNIYRSLKSLILTMNPNIFLNGMTLFKTTELRPLITIHQLFSTKKSGLKARVSNLI